LIPKYEFTGKLWERVKALEEELENIEKQLEGLRGKIKLDSVE